MEHPLHNIVHVKGKAKHRREPQAQSSQPTVTEAPAANPFAPADPMDVFSSLFNHKTFPPNRYGASTEEEYERRVAAARAKDQAIRDCTLCNGGYRPNGYLCDHIDHSASRLAEAQRKVQKERLQVVQGGGA